MSTATVEPKKSEAKLSQLEQLKKFTVVVADTGDFESIKGFQAAGRDDESEFDLCRDAKGEVRTFARRGNFRSKKIRV